MEIVMPVRGCRAVSHSLHLERGGVQVFLCIMGYEGRFLIDVGDNIVLGMAPLSRRNLSLKVVYCKRHHRYSKETLLNLAVGIF